MKKIYKVSIISSFLGLWFVSYLNSNVQTFLGFFLIFTFGVFHGANDLLLFARIKNNHNFDFIKTLFLYLATVLIAVVLFLFWPALALLFFIIVSGFHFGQQQFEILKQDCNLKYLHFFYLIYGLFILFFLFLFNTFEVITIIKDISAVEISVLHIKTIFLGLSVLLVCMSMLMLSKSKQFQNMFVLEIFFIVVFGILFYSTTLIWGFALYFILWHSLPSIGSQIDYIYGSTNQQTIFKYAKAGFAYWAISIAGIIILYVWFNDEKIFNSIFFSFLAAITFPHVVVIQKMFSSQKVS